MAMFESCLDAMALYRSHFGMSPHKMASRFSMASCWMGSDLAAHPSAEGGNCEGGSLPVCRSMSLNGDVAEGLDPDTEQPC